jgi:hypothetical protein
MQAAPRQHMSKEQHQTVLAAWRSQQQQQSNQELT